MSTLFPMDPFGPLVELPLTVVLLVVAWQIFKAVKFYRTRYAMMSGAHYLATLADAGARGEYRLGLALESFDPKGRMLFNVYVPRSDGTTSEVDAVLITSECIFVFESKNYSGWIFGREQDRTWTQTLNRRSKYQFCNPILQNKRHIEALSAYLGLSAGNFASVVVFSGKTVFKSLDAGGSCVVHLRDLGPALDAVKRSRPSVFDNERQSALFKELARCARASEETKAKHIADIRSKKPDAKCD